MGLNKWKSVASGLVRNALNRSRQPATDLEKALSGSRRAARNGHKIAKESLNNVDKVIGIVSQNIREHVETIEDGEVQTDDIAKQLRRQLEEVVTSLHELSTGTRKELQQRAKELDDFSITLFGRTMAGKSTLMEILTKGDGESIGRGGQRTTRDVRAYHWKGLRVIDVPGVAAFEGQEDEDLAYEAASKADLVLFLVTDDAPQPSEAQSLAKLRSMGKPILGICNVKVALADPDDMALFLYEPEKHFDAKRLDALVGQFHRLADKVRPGYPVVFIYVHLRARFLADQPAYQERREDLERASGFPYLEQSIIQKVVGRGTFLREKSFIDGAVVPLLELSEHLLQFSAQNSTSGRVLVNKKHKLKAWRDEFHDSGFAQINNFLDKEFGILRERIPTFAENYYDRENAGDQWARLVKAQQLEMKSQRLIDSLQADNHAALKEIARELKSELNFVSELSADSSIRMSSIFNSKFVAKALGGIGGAIALIALGSTPLGWAVSIGLGFLGWLFDSNSVKRQRQRRRLARQLEKDVDKLQKKLRKQLLDVFFQELLLGQIDVLYNDLNMVTNGVFKLADLQRDLAWDLNKEQKSLHRRLLRAALQQLNRPELDKMIVDIARVPGFATMLMVEPSTQFPGRVRDELRRLLAESVWFVVNNKNQRSLLKQAIGRAVKHHQISIERGIGVAHAPIDSLDETSRLRVRLGQQLTELHVMK